MNKNTVAVITCAASCMRDLAVVGKPGLEMQSRSSLMARSAEHTVSAPIGTLRGPNRVVRWQDLP